MYLPCFVTPSFYAVFHASLSMAPKSKHRKAKGKTNHANEKYPIDSENDNKEEGEKSTTNEEETSSDNEFSLDIFH